MRIINIIENTAGKNDCIPEHGLCFYVETKKHKILVDTGASGLLVENADQLGIDLADVDTVVITHGHYDHGGGILSFADLNDTATIYISEHAFQKFYSTSRGRRPRYIGLSRKVKDLPQLEILEDGVTKIDDELTIFSDIGDRYENPQTNSTLFIKEGSELVEDDFRHEQCLVVSSGGKKILFSGCAHNGIQNIMDKYVSIFKSEPDAVISGFHTARDRGYSKEDIKEIRNIAKDLAEYESVYYTGHCTGVEPFEEMQKILKDQIKYVHCGDEIKFGDSRKSRSRSRDMDIDDDIDNNIDDDEEETRTSRSRSSRASRRKEEPESAPRERRSSRAKEAVESRPKEKASSRESSREKEAVVSKPKEASNSRVKQAVVSKPKETAAAKKKDAEHVKSKETAPAKKEDTVVVRAEDTVRAKYRRITETLIKRGLSFTSMESCTSGLIASLITDTEGASAVMKGAYITYSNEAKVLHGVPKETIDKYGVYSYETAEDMAFSAGAIYEADVAIGVTGTMGNTDPSNDDSVPGEVYFAIASKFGNRSYHANIPPKHSRYEYKLAVAELVADKLIEIIGK
ncbi:MAG: nicotinamide-nucleotide amidohydrolase family protein [Butyrivibrio sp.]|nr:nicotinamide-nucleotide amidohydrolase family protein [Butyrivibrio sp.]